MIIIFSVFISGFFFIDFACAANNVYYSVGQDGTTDRKTCASSDCITNPLTATISAGTAIFSVAQTGNIGVGDRVTYNTVSIAYISRKISQTQWELVTATGIAPADASNQTVNSITREYTSLVTAEAGASDSNHINSTSLVASDIILNFPCYYDVGAESNPVTISGWTTDSTHYINIYTPDDTENESNQSQRHQGKNGNDFFQINTSLFTGYSFDNQQAYTKIDGIAFSGIFPSYSYSIHSTATAYISNCLFYGYPSNGHNGGIGIDHWGVMGSRIWNNIIINPKNSGIRTMLLTHIVYGNTIFGSTTNGILASNNTIAKNNLCSGNALDYSGTFDATSSNNLSTDSTSPNASATDCGGHSCRNQTVFFVSVSPSDEDLHLRSADISAKNSGINLSADLNLAFNTDIDGEARSLPVGKEWDIGADEVDYKITIINSPNVPEGSSVTINASQSDKITNGLIGMWSFDGPDINIATNTAYDRGSGGHNGTIANASPMPGKNGQALDFNGITSYASCGNVGSGIKTVSFWIKADDITDRKIIDIDGTRQIEINGSSQIVATSFPAATIYVDGVVGSTLTSDWHHFTITDTTGVNGSAVDLGRVSSGYFDGRLDEVRFYDRTFSTSEVGDLYRLGHCRIVQ